MIDLPHLYSGKVRDLYDAGDDRILMVASDRVSVFDVVLPDADPRQGPGPHRDLVVLVRPHRRPAPQPRDLSVDPADFPAGARPDADGRAMLVRRTEPVPMECIARGYLFGGAWKEYRERRDGAGPADADRACRRPSALPEPLFTPTTKADEGHDLPMTDDEAVDAVGADAFGRLRDAALAIYERGAAHAASRGIILADTKFEFGVAPDGELLLIDEVLTPDSSRYWPAEDYAPGGSPPSFDKQYVRDHYLTPRLGPDAARAAGAGRR